MAIPQGPDQRWFLDFVSDVIQDHADTGMDAILKQGRPGALPPNDRARRAGRMDSMVTKNVPPSVTVVGNPAHPLVKD